MAKKDTSEINETDESIKSNESSELESVSLDSVSNEFSSTMPDVQEHALEQERISAVDTRDKYSELKDRKGNPFDPSLHKTNAAGEPVLTATGKLSIKPGRKDGSPTKAAKSSISAVSITESAREKEQKARIAGIAAANMLTTLGMTFGYDEWRPIKQDGIDEQQNLNTAFGDYFVAKNIDDFPPGLALTIAVCGYVLPRFTMPQTKERAGGLYLKIKKWYANRKLKKHGLKAEEVKKDEKTSEKSKLVA